MQIKIRDPLGFRRGSNKKFKYKLSALLCLLLLYFSSVVLIIMSLYKIYLEGYGEKLKNKVIQSEEFNVTESWHYNVSVFLKKTSLGLRKDDIKCH